MLASGVLAPILIGHRMHIPDGYLSPATAAVMLLLVLPFWVRGTRRLRQALSARLVPVIALVAAFSFVIMMFNIPLPGGTTGHVVGGALAAIVLGPEMATLAISMALVIQALLFGDGGVLSIGANCFNMAVVLPYVSYGVYRLVASGEVVNPRRRFVAAAAGGWSGLTLAALFAGVEFGLQPLLFHTANGAPLYAPFPLSVAVPAMLIPHVLVASVAEGLLTALILAYLARAQSPILAASGTPVQAGATPAAGSVRLLWVMLAVLVVATPLGLLAPGTAWGEWSSRELAGLGLTFVPAGLARLETLWGAPLARYEMPVLGNANLGYLVSAAIGVALVAVLAWLYAMIFASRPATAQDGNHVAVDTE